METLRSPAHLSSAAVPRSRPHSHTTDFGLSQTNERPFSRSTIAHRAVTPRPPPDLRETACHELAGAQDTGCPLASNISSPSVIAHHLSTLKHVTLSSPSNVAMHTKTPPTLPCRGRQRSASQTMLS